MEIKLYLQKMELVTGEAGEAYAVEFGCLASVAEYKELVSLLEKDSTIKVKSLK